MRSDATRRSLGALLGVLLFASLPCLGKHKEKNWETGKVLSQEITTQDGGIIVAPVGRYVYGVPVTFYSSKMEVRVGGKVLTWRETGRPVLVLTVGEDVRFYRKKGLFIVLDKKGKKHKYELVHAEKSRQ